MLFLWEILKWWSFRIDNAWGPSRRECSSSDLLSCRGGFWVERPELFGKFTKHLLQFQMKTSFLIRMATSALFGRPKRCLRGREYDRHGDLECVRVGALDGFVWQIRNHYVGTIEGFETITWQWTPLDVVSASPHSNESNHLSCSHQWLLHNMRYSFFMLQDLFSVLIYWKILWINSRFCGGK